nr:hypothetical protein Iba_chr12fCG13530 [Ipomoea batatas]
MARITVTDLDATDTSSDEEKLYERRRMLPMLTRDPITKEVKSVKANWEDLITDKGAEIIRLEGLKANSQTRIHEGDSSIVEVMSFIKEAESLIREISLQLEKIVP